MSQQPPLMGNISSKDVHNDFVELSKILKNLEAKYTNLETERNQIPILKHNIGILESQLKETSKKFEDSELNKNRLLEENKKIPILNEKIKNLESQLNESTRKLEENTTNYTDQLNVVNSEKNALNDKLELINTELNAKNLECAKLSEENTKNLRLNEEILKENEKIKEKYENVTPLSFENEELQKNYEKVTTENSSLKVKLDDSDRTALILNQSVNTMEQKLKHLTLQLENEIATCVKLETENQKLKSLSSTTNSQQMEENIKVEQFEEKLKELSYELEKEVSKNTALGEYNRQLDRLISGFKSKAKSDNIASQSVENLRNSQEQLNDYSNFKVLIRDVPTEQILNPLEKTVIDLASKMSIAINRNDITKVRTMERKGLSEYSNKVSLLVEFKSAEIKTTFLSNRSKLRFNSSTKNITLKDFVENEIYSLYLYANKHLRSNGFQRIYYKDNQVFARKNDSSAEIEIKSRNQVDELANRN